MKEKEIAILSGGELEKIWQRDCQRDPKVVLRAVSTAWRRVLNISDNEFYLPVTSANTTETPQYIEWDTNIMLDLVHRVYSSISKDSEKSARISFLKRVRDLITPHRYFFGQPR